ncbi:trichohyalin-like [Diprion similis]|uniref:trichohyalin-like n=1 Tax=Diprion similis TaxID=362088 RepID=UPI001EF9015E|nr:trichohyalin-like [Diprion similis]
MRRTRHVVLPVRSWEHVGLLIVSLACLTLGLVSRDREGQAGSLAGPDLQHCAPHKVDACPNETSLARTAFNDDSAKPSSGLTNPTEQPIEYQTTVSISRDNRDSRSTRRISRLDVSRSAKGRDARLLEERDGRWARQSRDSRSVNRDSRVRNVQASPDRRNTLHLSVERRSEDQTRRIRVARSLDRDFVSRNSRFASERRNANFQRSSERGNDRLARSVRQSAPLSGRTEREDGRLIRESRNARLEERNSVSRNAESLSRSRRDVRSLKRDFSSEKSRLQTTEYRAERQNRLVRESRNLERDSAARTSRIAFDRSSQRVHDTRSLDRADPITRTDRSSAVRNSDARLSVREAETRDFRARISRSTSERREDRLTRRVREARLYENNRAIRSSRHHDERRETRDFRSLERDSAARITGSTLERVDRRSNRQVRATRFLERESRVRNADLTRDRRTDIRAAEGRVESRNQKLDEVRRQLERESARRSLHDSATDLRVIRRTRDERMVERVRSLRSTERTPRTTSVRRTGNDGKEFLSRDAKTAVNDEALIVARRALDRSVSGRRGQPQVKGEKSGADRRRERIARETRASGLSRAEENRNVRTRRAVVLPQTPVIEHQDNRDDRRGKMANRDERFVSANIFNKQISPSTTYEGLRQTVILVLCALYGASLYSRKGSLARNIITHANRFLIW